MTLGNYPDMPLEKAREAARAARSFREVAEEYLAGKRMIAEESRRDWYRYLNKDIYPDLGHLAIRGVTLDEVRVLVKRLAKRSQSVARRDIRNDLGQFGYVIGDGCRWI